MSELEKLLPAFKLILVSYVPIYLCSSSINVPQIDLVQQGMSEKVALVVNFICAFLTGFILAYSRSWRLALAMSSILPCIGITGAIMNRFVSKYMQ